MEVGLQFCKMWTYVSPFLSAVDSLLSGSGGKKNVISVLKMLQF